MKKIFLSTILCLILCVCSLGLFGCKEVNYTKNDLDELYTSIKTEETTSQFFDGEKLVVNFDSEKITFVSTDKNYIFPEIYKYYLTTSSSLLSEVIKRVGSLSTLANNFSQSQINSIYNKLNDVKSKLNKLAQSKLIFEISNGNLHYKSLINSYNNLITSLYNLNNTFANFYFIDSLGKVDFSVTELTDSNIRDMLRYQLLKTSIVSFKYELLNFVTSNPLGEINTWFNSTITLKNYVNLAKQTLTVLDNYENLASHAGSNKNNIRAYFLNMQIQQEEYDQEYSSFLKSINKFNVKSYLISTNKNAYLESSSYYQQSYYQIIENFLIGRYLSYYNALTAVVNYL